jgi:hypothetical protein
MLIIVSETNHGGRFHATLGDSTPLLKSSRTPLLDSARILLARRYDPNTRLVMRHLGSTIDALTTTVGTAAKLTVQDNGVGKPTFCRHHGQGETSLPASHRLQTPPSLPAQAPASAQGFLQGDPHQMIFEFRIAA